MNKYKYLIKNFGLLTISSFSTKFLTFLFLPLYTSILTSDEYGTYDLIYTTVVLCVPILTLNINEAILRFCLDHNVNISSLLIISFKYVSLGLGIIILFVTLNREFKWVSFISDYSVVFVFLYLFSVITEICNAYARGIEKITDVAVSGIIGTITTILFNIIFLVIYPLSLEGFLWSSIIGLFFQSSYLVIRTKIYKAIIRIHYDKTLEREMIYYSCPLILNAVTWWINSSFDRYVVTYYCGLSDTGIYSVAYKIPTILSIVNAVFNQAWILSATKESKDENAKTFYRNVYKVYNAGMVIFCSLLLVVNKQIAYILFQSEFFKAWQYSPFLLISVIFGSLSGYFGTLFCTIKQTKIIGFSVLIGAIINIVLSIYLVQLLGVIGVALATIVSYILIWLLRYVTLSKFLSLHLISIKDLACYSLLIIQALLYLINSNTVNNFFIQIVIFFFVLFINRQIISSFISKTLRGVL